MKININQTTQINNYIPVIKNKNDISLRSQQNIVNDGTKPLLPSGLNLANFYNVSFMKHVKLNPDMEFLLKFSDRFKCAYSGKPMLSKPKAKAIYQKLEKRPNAQSAINLLQNFQMYMYDIEKQVFDILTSAPYKNKRDFQNILSEYLPAALERLKLKQFAILNSTNPLIETLSDSVAAQVLRIRDSALTKMNDGTFGRKIPLEELLNIKSKGEDRRQLLDIYRRWYTLPSSGTDLDAFIVQASKMSHLQIAKRLISPSVASVEHIKPHSRGGSSNLTNFILVAAKFNNTRSSLPLSEYFALNPDIDFEVNLQKYMDTAIAEIHDRKSEFYERGYYPAKIKEAIEKETGNAIQLNTDRLNPTSKQRYGSGLDKLRVVYKVVEK